MYDPMKEEDSINSFRGDYRFLSNFYKTAITDQYTILKN
jgi:hypothetical protein